MLAGAMPLRLRTPEPITPLPVPPPPPPIPEAPDPEIPPDAPSAMLVRADPLRRPRRSTPASLRKLVPGHLLMKTLSTAALTGLLPTYNPNTGAEEAVAVPVSTPERIGLAKFLLDKVVPNARPTDMEERQVDPTNLPTDPEEIKRLPMSELAKAIEAQYTINPSPDSQLDSDAP